MFSTDLLSPAPAISDCFSILKEQPSFSEGAVMASDMWIFQKRCFYIQSLVIACLNWWKSCLGFHWWAKICKTILCLHGSTVWPSGDQPDQRQARHLPIPGTAWPVKEGKEELGERFLLGMLQWKEWRWRQTKGEEVMEKEEGLSVFSCETWAVPCVYFCNFLWSKYCRAVITAVQLANNQQMRASISLWVVTFDGGIDFPRDAEILWQLSLTPSLHVLSGQHLSGFVVRAALVAAVVFRPW